MLFLSVVLLARSPALLESVKHVQVEAVRVLLAAGADPNLPDENGVLPLDFAALSNRPDIARLLLEGGALVNATVGGSTALDFAVARGNVETARVLIEQGADVRRVFPSGRTPLHIAVANGHLSTVELLIDRGAEPNTKDLNGVSPLDEAVRRNIPEVAAVLLDAGAKPSPGMLRAVLKANRAEVARALLAHTSESLGPLLADALSRRQPQIIAVLLQAGADVNGRDASGFTPLHDAALAGNLATVRVLLENGADVNAGARDSGATPLYMAATMGREEVVSLLLEKGADPNKGPSPAKAAQKGGFDRIAASIQARTK